MTNHSHAVVMSESDAANILGQHTAELGKQKKDFHEIDLSPATARIETQ